MTVRLRSLLAVAPLLAAGLLALGSRCAETSHSLFFYAGMIHADEGCVSGAALGPSLTQLAGLTVVVFVGALGNSAAVRDAIGRIVDRFGLQVSPAAVPSVRPVSAGYSRRLAWGVRRGSAARDPPTA